MLVETMPYGILVLDNQNRIQDINGVGMSFLGILNKNVIGFPVESSGVLYKDLLNAALKGDSIDRIKIKHANGFKIFSINKYAIEKTQGSRLIVINDITKHILAEEEIKQKNEELQKVNAEKDKFFSIISHDLKSPFNGMLGLLESLANDYSDFSEEERKIIIQSSHQSAAKAYKLLNELLEWSRLQNNKVEIKKEKVNLKEIIQGNIDVLGSAAIKKEISIISKIKRDTFITLDVNSINTVVRNLLNNAIKFTPTGGSIEISVEQSESNFVLSIADTGVGMSDETISKLFRLDENITMPGTNNEKGTGLGLTICNDIVKLNGWKMTLESQLGKGTTFRVLLPLVKHEGNNTP
jgi:signal transduction histidine kinase